MENSIILQRGITRIEITNIYSLITLLFRHEASDIANDLKSVLQRVRKSNVLIYPKEIKSIEMLADALSELTVKSGVIRE